MFKRIIFVTFLALGILFQGANLWADDDGIMDVDDNAAVFSGSWINSTVRILYYGDDYEAAHGSGGSGTTATATFTTARYTDVSGYYQVYVRWTAGAQRATNATYRIYDDLGTYKGACVQNQTINGGAWQFCNEVYLDAGRRGRVVLGNDNVPYSRYVCADAVRFVRVSKDRDDIVDEPGIDVSQSNTIIASGLEVCNVAGGSVNWTNLASVTLTTPRPYGRIWVHANGISVHNNDEWARVCIAPSGSGCTSWAPILDQSSGEVAEGSWDNETRWVVSDSFYATGASETFYLKACRQSATADVQIHWDDFVGMYFPITY